MVQNRTNASPVDWSVGLVEWRRGESLDHAMAEADEELYRAKRAVVRITARVRDVARARSSLGHQATVRSPTHVPSL